MNYSIRALLATIFLGAALFLIFSVRIKHPELTETQLFLEHWRTWLVSFLLCVVGTGLITWKE